MFTGPLTADQLAKATRLNAIWVTKLGPENYPIAAAFRRVGIDSVTDPAKFAEDVASFQASHGMNVDGILGPKTAAKINGATWQEPAGTDYVVLNGSRHFVPGGIKVLDWTETDLAFGRGHGLIRPRTKPITMGVLHTTGGEGSGHQVWNTLVHRNLSVDGLLDSDGTFFQYNDPGVSYTAHGGWTNETSWGIEITNDIDPHHGVVQRPLVRGTLNGQPHEWDGLTPAQATVLPKLVGIFCDAFKITKQVPTERGKVLDGPPVPEELLERYRRAKASHDRWKQHQIGEEAIRVMRPVFEDSVVGHAMVSLGHKPDPSPDVFDILRSAGFGLKETQGQGPL